MQWLRSLIAHYPRHALVLGKALLLAGGILVIGAVFARAQLLNTNAQRAEARLPPLQTVAEAYPQYPTAMVPEGPVGFGIAAALVLAGVALTGMAEKAGKK
jgi:hypothetical protein